MGKIRQFVSRKTYSTPDFHVLKKEIGSLRAKLLQGNYDLCSDVVVSNAFSKNDNDIYRIVQFCQQSGARLSQVLDEIDKVLDEMIEMHELQAKALATPNITMKVLRVLPLVALSLGFLLGANTLAVFITPVGFILALIGFLLWLIGQKMVQKMIVAYQSLQVSNLFQSVPIQLVMIKAAILSGSDMLTAMKQLEISGAKELDEGLPFAVAKLPVGFECLEDAYKNGVSPIGSIVAQISLLYASSREQIKVQGEELGIRLLVPLGAFFLPSFILLGVIPTIIALASSF